LHSHLWREFSARGDITTGGLTFGNANLQFEMKSQSGDIVNMPGARDISPFFQLARVKRKLFSKPRVELLSADQPSCSLDDVTPATADESLYLDMVLDSEER